MFTSIKILHHDLKADRFDQFQAEKTLEIAYTKNWQTYFDK